MNPTAVSQYVDAHRDEAVAFLQAFLRIPSPTGQEKAAAQFVADTLAREGFSPQMPALDPERPNVVCRWKGSAGKTLLFNGHLDVFPPEGTPARNPWSGDIAGGRIYARGATDMKAGAAAGLLAVCFLKRMGFEPAGELTLALNCDEEQGSRFGLLYCLSLGLLKADFTICMEASEDTVIVDTDGRIAWKVSFRSDGWHAGTRLDKTDALQMALRAARAIAEYDRMLLAERYFGGNDFGAVISVTGISAGKEGKTINMHPAECTLWIDRRYTQGETVESAEDELSELLEKDAVTRGHWQLERLFAGPRLSMDPEDPDIQACIAAYRDIFGTAVRPGRRNGGGDAVKLAVHYGQKVPQFGPGVYAVLGSDDEYVELDQYIGFIKVYMLFATRYLGQRPESKR